MRKTLLILPAFILGITAAVGHPKERGVDVLEHATDEFKLASADIGDNAASDLLAFIGTEPAPADPVLEAKGNEYEVIKNRDWPGNDIKQIPGADLETLKKACDDDPACVGFNVGGWLKKSAEGPGAAQTGTTFYRKIIRKKSQAPARMTVAVLAFEDKTGDPQAAHWGHTIQGLLDAQLREVKSIRVLRRGSAEFGFRQLKLKPGDPVELVQARKIGELIEARRVVWGSYQRSGENWQATVRVLNVASGNASAELRAESANWYEVRDNITEQILKVLAVTPSEKERSKMARRGTTSVLASESLSKAYALYVERKPFSEVEAFERKALTADPQFAEAYAFLATSLAGQGQFAPAEEAVRQALKLRPDYAVAHLTLGVLLFIQGKFAEDETELRESLRLDSDEPHAFIRLGEFYAKQNKLDEAITAWNEAKQLDPTSADVHAHLGHAYALQGDRVKALVELKEAERLDPEDPNAEQMIGLGYDTLHETPAAIEHYEKFVAVAGKLMGNPALISGFEERARELKATLTPHFVTVPMPRVYTEGSLAASLRERLTDLESMLITHPLSSTPEMKYWAERLTQGAKDDLDKARKLFEALTRHIDPGAGGSRTAQEVFAAWNDSRVSFRCQEYARLYVALARDVGLKAFFVMVERDFQGRAVPHACAGVFAEDKALLADPSYRWFGVPHKKFGFRDDLEATGDHLNQLEGDVPRLRVAARLQPNSALAHFNLASSLIGEGRLDEARLALKNGLRLEPESWHAHAAQGAMAGSQSQWEQAINHFQKCIELNPDWDKPYFGLAEALRNQGKLKEAREQYRAYLQHQTDPVFREPALHSIAEINEKLGGE